MATKSDGSSKPCTCQHCNNQLQRLNLEKMQIENDYLKEKHRIEIAKMQLEVKILINVLSLSEA